MRMFEENGKTEEMNKFIDGMSKLLFGRNRCDLMCVACGTNKVNSEDFRDDISRKEFKISGFCQKCQDEVFGK